MPKNVRVPDEQLAKFVAAAAKKWKMDATEFEELARKHLAKEKRQAAKGKNGKGPVAGFIVFSKAQRAAGKHEDLEFRERNKAFGDDWRALSDDQRQEWNSRAVEENRANGLEPTPKATPKAKTPAKTAAKTPAKTPSKTAAKTPAKTAAEPKKATKAVDSKKAAAEPAKVVKMSKKEATPAAKKVVKRVIKKKAVASDDEDSN